MHNEQDLTAYILCVLIQNGGLSIDFRGENDTVSSMHTLFNV